MTANWRHSFPILSALALMLLPFGCAQAAPTSDVMQDVSDTIPAAEGSVRIETRLDRSTAQIAEPITMSLAVTAPKGIAITFPETGPTLGLFDVIAIDDRFDIPEPNDVATRRWTRTYTLEGTVAGSLEIPSVAVQSTDRRGSEPFHDTIASEGATVQIVSLLEGKADPMQFRDIKGVVSLPEPNDADRGWLLALGGAGLLLVIAAGTLVAWQRRGKPLSADAWAMAEFDRIERAAQAGNPVPELYWDVTDVLRHYIDRRFELGASRLTTAEFLSAVRHEKSLPVSHQAPLQAFLTHADMVKFACLEPTVDEAIATVSMARAFVIATADVEAVDESASDLSIAPSPSPSHSSPQTEVIA